MNRQVIFNLFVLLLTILSRTPLSAQAPAVVYAELDSLKGSSISASDTLAITQNQFDLSSAPTSLTWSSAVNPSKLFVKKTYCSVLLEVDHSAAEDASTLYDYYMGVTATWFDAAFVQHTDTITLHVKNEPGKLKKMQDRDAHVFEGAVYVQAIITSINGGAVTDPADNLGFKVEVVSEIYEDFDFISDSVYTHSNWSGFLTVSNQLIEVNRPSTSIKDGEVEWEIEWLFVDKYRAKQVSGVWQRSGSVEQDSLFYDFKFNATRIRLPASQTYYPISHIYDEGYLLFRIRSIGRTGPNREAYSFGKWWPSTPKGRIGSYNDSLKLVVNTAVTHEGDDLTWQYVSTYAENGKKKEVISYFDGLNKNRQAVTRLSTSNVAVVGETIYDYEGRPTVQILPAPVDSSELKLYRGFNKDNSGDVYRAANFDGKTGADSMSDASGASRYYSDQNNFNSLHRDLIPDAKEYPFSQTVYMSDQTGRVKYQGGVGADHKIGSGHETRYEYSKPSQDMLNKLFGSEVGHNVHYKENIVFDANGQVSVSYVDQHGRVVATSIAGETPENLAPLSSHISPNDADFVLHDLDSLHNKRIPLMGTTTYSLTYPYVSKGDGSHSFWYELQPEKYLLTCNGICFDCNYDLSISIRNDLDTLIWDTVVYIGQLDTNINCSPEDTLRLWSGNSVHNSGFSINLPLGKYTINKTLEIDMAKAEDYWEAYVASDSSCLPPLIIEFEPCDSTEQWINNQSPGGASQGETPVYCRSLYQNMLTDVFPGGQYGAILDSSGVFLEDGSEATLLKILHKSAVSVFKENNILRSRYSPKPDSTGYANWRNPPIPYREDTSLALVYDTLTKTMVQPEELSSLKLFIDNFQPEWAKSLVYYHPEYPYVEACLAFDSSFFFDERLMGTSTYAEAEAKGFIDNSSNNIRMKVADPIFSLSPDTPAFAIPPGIIWSTTIARLDSIFVQAHWNAGNPMDLKDFSAGTACLNKRFGDVLCWEGSRGTFGESGLWDEERDLQWQVYRSEYLSRKHKVLRTYFGVSAHLKTRGLSSLIRRKSGSYNVFDDYTNANGKTFDGTIDSLWEFEVIAHTEVRFDFPEDDYGFDADSLSKKETGDSIVSKNSQAMKDYATNRCSSYVDVWKHKLATCGLSDAVMDRIITGYLQVCEATTNEGLPLGSQGYLKTPTDSGYTSFKDVLQTIVGSGNRYCSHLLIDVPGTKHRTYFKDQEEYPDDSTGTFAEANVDCGCDLLESEFAKFEKKVVETSNCKTYGRKLEGRPIQYFLNQLDSLGWLGAGKGHFPLPDNPDYSVFHNSLKPSMSWSSTYYKGHVDYTHGHLSIMIQDNDTPTVVGNKCNIVLYDWEKLRQKYNLKLGDLVFSEIQSARFKVDQATPAMSGFRIKVTDGVNSTYIYGASPCFRVFDNRTCLEYDYTYSQLEEKTYEFVKNGYEISYNDFLGLKERCIEKGYHFGVFDKVEAECKGQILDADKAYGLFSLIREMAADGSVLDNTTYFPTTDNYFEGCPNYSGTTGKYDWLPNNYSSYSPRLLAAFDVYNNFRWNIDSNVYGRKHILWGGFIGFECDTLLNQCYVSLSALNSADSILLTSTLGGLDALDSISHLRYHYDKNAWIVDAHKGSTTIQLIFDNCGLSYCPEVPDEIDTCTSRVRYTIQKGDKEYRASCTDCKTYAVQDFLNALVQDVGGTKLLETVPFDISQKDGYRVTYPNGLYRQGTTHQYQLLNNPDVTPKSDTLHARFGQFSDTSYAQLWLFKSDTNVLFSSFDSITQLSIDTCKLAEYIAAQRKLRGATFYFVFKAYYQNGSTTDSMWVHGYTNTYSLGDCIPLDSKDHSVESKVITCPNCIECKDIKSAYEEFQGTYPKMGLDHINFWPMLTTFLNERFNNNYFETEWLQYIDNCELWRFTKGRKVACNLFLKIDASDTLEVLDSVITIQQYFGTTFGNTFEFTRDSLAGGGNTYCFNLSRTNRDIYSKVLARLNTLDAYAPTSNDLVEDQLVSDSLVVEFIKTPLNAPCRGLMAPLSISDSFGIDSLVLYRYDLTNSPENAHPVIRYIVDFQGRTLKEQWNLKYKLDTVLSGCAYTEIKTLWFEDRQNKAHLYDTVCVPKVDASGDACVSCAEVRSNVVEFHYKDRPVGPTAYETSLEGYLEEKMGRYFDVFRAKKACETCEGMVTYVCEEPNDRAFELEAFLNEMAINGYLNRDIDSAIVSRGTGIGTNLFDKLFLGNDLVFESNMKGNDTQHVVLVDSVGAKVYVGLFPYNTDLFDWANIDSIKNIRLVPNTKGENHWFEVDAYDSVQMVYNVVRGYISRFSLANCCLFDDLEACYKPLFRPDRPKKYNCDSFKKEIAFVVGAINQGRELEKLHDQFIEDFRAQCAGGFDRETFKMKAPQLQHHFTLYYYDQAGNLVRTVPPKGVELLDTLTTAPTNSWRNLGNKNNSQRVLTDHKLSTYYAYNSLNQVLTQSTPDGGTSVFWYDRLGRLVFSQNAKQKADANDYLHSYTRYDQIGRIVEVGEIALGYAVSQDSLLRDTGYFNSRYTQGRKTQITETTYDHPVNQSISDTFGTSGQQNLRNRVSSVTYRDYFDEDYQFATHYSYDVHGNVKTLLQEIAILKAFGSDIKRVDYYYDLVSGNVNEVHYQKDQPDQFFHRYTYDADNRIVTTETSKDQMLWDRDANYEYYLHGPLARTTLGDLNVQGIDYAYTIHGWLKAVNGEALREHQDPGYDGVADTLATHRPEVARDAFGFTLGYYHGDYSSIGNNNLFLSRGSSNLGGKSEKIDLFNGNIGHMVTANRALMNAEKGVLGQNFKYDQLNRISGSEVFLYKPTSPSDTSGWSGISPEITYYTEYGYDPNGNLLQLKRMGHIDDSSVVMDNLDYHYNNGSNQLSYVADLAGNDELFSTQEGGVEDLNSGQDPLGNYQYDPIGNLIKDEQEGIKEIEWNVYGKVKEVTRADTAKTPGLEFKYDASGNRVVKIVKPMQLPSTWTYHYYVRDAQGNVMATYKLNNALEDSVFNNRIITDWLELRFNSDTVGAMFSEYHHKEGAYKQTLIDVLQEEYDGVSPDTLLMKRFTLDQWLTWDNTLSYSILNGYAEDSLNYDGIIAELILDFQSEVVDGVDLSLLVNDVLNDDVSDFFLNCFAPGDLQSMYSNLGLATPIPGTKATLILNLRGVAQNLLVNQLTTTFQSQTIAHLKTCVSSSLLIQALRTPSQSKLAILSGVGSSISAVDLADFFVNDGDPKAFRPMNMLTTHGAHSYILNVIASASPKDFILRSLGIIRIVVDEYINQLPGFSASHYIDMIGLYFNQSVVQDLFTDIGDRFVYRQKLQLSEHHLYGSSRLGIRRDTLSLVDTRFKSSEIDTNTGMFVKSTVFFDRRAKLDTTRANRILTKKSYELSNHLGNVLATVSDKRVFNRDTVIGSATLVQWDADVRQAQDYYPFGMLMPDRIQSDTQLTTQAVHISTTYDTIVQQYTFDSILSTDWSAKSGSSIALDNGRLKITTPNQSGYAACTLNTVAGKKYRLTANIIYGSADSVNFNGKAIPGLAQLLNKNYIPSGKASYEFTATTSSVRFRVKRLDNNNQGTISFFVDNVTLAQVRDTFYTDTVTVATGDGYRFAFNGMERDDSWNGVGNSYDFGARIYDARLGRWLALDPLMVKYPEYSGYIFSAGNPILYKDFDGRDWIYYDEESGKELNRTKSKWNHFHWLTGHKKTKLSKSEQEHGGFFAYVNFHGVGDLHASLVDVKTGNLYEARHPVNENGDPVNGAQFKDEGKSFYEANSVVSKFESDGNYEFANEEWWTYTVQNEDGTLSDKSPDQVGVTYIWIPNRGALLEHLENSVGGEVDWTPVNNCKTFCRDALMHGYEGITPDQHLEIRDLLKDEDVHPGSWYNEFEENKSVDNPEKKDDD